MGRGRREPFATNRGDADTRSKIDKLRAQRLEDMAARQAAGTWGQFSVWEVTHGPTGEVFIQLWKGRTAPDLLKLPARRTPAKWAIEHQQLMDWLAKNKLVGFQLSLVGWDLSESEARRVQQTRIAEHRAEARMVANVAV